MTQPTDPPTTDDIARALHALAELMHAKHAVEAVEYSNPFGRHTLVILLAGDIEVHRALVAGMSGAVVKYFEDRQIWQGWLLAMPLRVWWHEKPDTPAPVMAAQPFGPLPLGAAELAPLVQPAPITDPALTRGASA